MRSSILVAAVLVGTLSASRVVRAEPLPPGSLGVVTGIISGTGADAKHLGYGYLLGFSAAWQPMTTERRVNWTAKWSTMWGTMYSADASRISDQLATLHMDLMAGIRIRPGENPTRYISLRAGGALLRADQVIPPKMHRSFAGAIASLGIDQYIAGWMVNVDVRYGLIGTGPAELGVVIGVAKTGP